MATALISTGNALLGVVNVLDGHVQRAVVERLEC
jgi:hypothetical protein